MVLLFVHGHRYGGHQLVALGTVQPSACLTRLRGMWRWQDTDKAQIWPETFVLLFSEVLTISPPHCRLSPARSGEHIFTFGKFSSAHPFFSLVLFLQLFNLSPVKISLSVGEKVFNLCHIFLRHVTEPAVILVPATRREEIPVGAEHLEVVLVVDRPLLLLLSLVLLPKPEWRLWVLQRRADISHKGNNKTGTTPIPQIGTGEWKTLCPINLQLNKYAGHTIFTDCNMRI